MELTTTHVDQQIAELNRKIENLKAMQSSILEDRRRYDSALSVLRSLPREILAEIFCHILPSTLGNLRVLSQVCRSWRSLIHGSPWYWTDIILVGRGRFENLKSQWQHFIRCADGRPISLTIRELHPFLLACLLDTLFARAVVAHWESLTIPATHTPHIQKILNYYAKFPQETIHVTGFHLTSTTLSRGFEGNPNDPAADEDWEEDQSIADIIDLTSFRSLQSLRLDTVHLDIALVRVDWSNLTSLSSGAGLVGSLYLDVLARCQRLVSLTISPNDDEEEAEMGSLVRLEQLRKLVIKTKTHPFTLFERLCTPGLQELILNIPVTGEDYDHSLNHFLDRLNGSLEVLKCSFGLFLQSSRSSKSFSTITKLQITGPYDELQDCPFSSLFEYLTVHPVDSPQDWFVGLKQLEILNYPSRTPKDISSCREMMRSRCIEYQGATESDGIPRSLRKLVVTEKFGDDSEDLEDDEDERRDGGCNVFEELAKFRSRGLLSI